MQAVKKDKLIDGSNIKAGDKVRPLAALLLLWCRPPCPVWTVPPLASELLVLQVLAFKSSGVHSSAWVGNLACHTCHTHLLRSPHTSWLYMLFLLPADGFSLVRKVLEVSKTKLRDPCPWDASITIGEVSHAARQLCPPGGPICHVATLLPACRLSLHPPSSTSRKLWSCMRRWAQGRATQLGSQVL